MEKQINEYITLKLGEGKTNIYVLDELYRDCKYLLLNISRDHKFPLEEITSVDHARELLGHSLDPILHPENEGIIPPETEFWGHCSNLQAWVENDYDTRIIDSRLGFPLLKKLSEAGDKKARRVFKEEIVKRLVSGWPPTIEFLLEGNYLDYFNDDEREIIFKEIKKGVMKAFKESGHDAIHGKLLQRGFLYLLNEEEKKEIPSKQFDKNAWRYWRPKKNLGRIMML